MQTETINVPNSDVVHTRTYGPVTVDKVFQDQFNPEITRAQLRQVVTTVSKYPSRRISNSLNQNPFQVTEFENIKPTEYPPSVENRIAWMQVPENSTKESVEERLSQFPNMRLYRILHSRPILTPEDIYACESERYNTSKDDIANKQVGRYPANADNAGQVIKDANGKIFFRRICISLSGNPDIDERTPEPQDTYLTPEIASELENVVLVKDQSL